jgi:hypothetical protein
VSTHVWGERTRVTSDERQGSLLRIVKAILGVPDRSRVTSLDTGWALQGRPAEGTVVEARQLHRWLSDPPSHYRWVVVVQVRPDDEPAFEVGIEDWFSVRQPPVVGDTLHVVYDPDFKARVIVDHRSDADREGAIGYPGPANDDNVLTEAQWARSASIWELNRGVYRGFSHKFKQLRGRPDESGSKT